MRLDVLSKKTIEKKKNLRERLSSCIDIQSLYHRENDRKQGNSSIKLTLLSGTSACQEEGRIGMILSGFQGIKQNLRG